MVIFIFVAAHFTDKVFRALTARRLVVIISARWAELINGLMEIQIRTTKLQGTGGFQRGEQPLLLSITTAKRITDLKRIVARTDENAFIAIMTADDVTGVEVGNQPHW